MTLGDNGRAETATKWAVRALGAVLALIGLVLAGGGAWLAAVGGSPYYLLAGAALIGSGVLLWRLSLLGAAVYALTFLATVVWALWEVGLDGWGLIPRLFGPAVLMALVLWAAAGLVAPARRAIAWLILGGFVVTALAFSVGVYAVDGPKRAAPLPGPRFAMSEPSLHAAGADWPAYGGTYSARRYSPLSQITPSNVGRLERAWVFHTNDLPSAQAKGTYGAENTPLKVGDTLYVCTPKSIVYALDAATGRQRWRHDPKVPDEWIPYTAACRGVAYYAVPAAAAGQACATRIIWGTLDGRVIAVDAETGAPCADFGQGGEVDAKAGMGPVTPGLFSINSPPTIVRGTVVVGHQVLDGQKLDAPSGAILGYDAVTGALKWSWDPQAGTLPGLPPAGRIFPRGTPNSWTSASGDEALGLVYVPMGNAAVDYWSSKRTPQENAVSSALVALDAGTGEVAWVFQTAHKDVWDYDLGSQATLADYPTPGGLVPALILPSKQGELYVLDRRTGRPLTKVEERPVPQGGVEPSQRSSTQPYSGFHSLAKPRLTEADMWGMSPIDQMACRIQYRLAEYRGPYTPPTTRRRWIEYPGYNGGSDWGGVAVDPVRGVIVANYNDMPNYNRLIPREVADRKGWAPRGDARGGSLGGGAEGAGDPQIGAPYAIQVNAGWRLPFTGLLCKEPPYGGIRAIDLATGRTLWDRPFGTARRNGPFGIPSHLPFHIGTPNNGGAVVTASGVIFISAATDDLIRAIDLKTGKTLWKAKLPGGGQATPMTYEIGGRQYLVIMAGGHHFMETPVSDALVAYALPAKG
ncbi:MAG: membrane-bound PQQ-dependent dehydrogenase, glucose/quinate/shikimate family [Phenylobacterium sp.]|uniref:membrane-bound PQQ-dependent dehydrogenase, glucose/quinate/shikimate family n=1 Tax=Phenylobacterium sp. TaxID=1871053 RepID=UPI0025F29783|nr:membrane-bound PQQ-dependent dehydrogenase, glucose/quinate/shikimate family [Phenylobacterium sp.]MBI1196574.1 membrane-bound PQQ-dependent dehydrogenase, glucose/quinate/shikimate family [Phenylobacterium sp.]